MSAKILAEEIDRMMTEDNWLKKPVMHERYETAGPKVIAYIEWLRTRIHQLEGEIGGS